MIILFSKNQNSTDNDYDDGVYSVNVVETIMICK